MFGFGYTNIVLLVSAVIGIAFDNCVQPVAVVALAVYVPSPSTVTTNVVAVAPGTATPFLNHCIGVPAGVTVAVKVVVLNGLRIVVGFGVIDIVGWVFTVTVTLAQPVVLQVPSALTKYVVVAVGVTVMLAPVPTAVPPQLALYHLQLAPVPNEPPLTVSVTACGPQMVVADAVMAVGITDTELMVMVVVAVTAAQPPAAASV